MQVLKAIADNSNFRNLSKRLATVYSWRVALELYFGLAAEQNVTKVELLDLPTSFYLNSNYTITRADLIERCDQEAIAVSLDVLHLQQEFACPLRRFRPCTRTPAPSYPLPLRPCNVHVTGAQAVCHRRAVL